MRDWSSDVCSSDLIGHVKSVSAMTGEDLDDVTGRALLADGLSTVLAGAGGGSGTTTYAENIGVMAATRVYSTAAYVVAALTALGLSMLPHLAHLKMLSFSINNETPLSNRFTSRPVYHLEPCCPR